MVNDMRLIDADAFKNVNLETLLCFNGTPYVKVSEMFQLINNQPTAYDVEKVISKVDKALFEFGDGTNCASCAFREMCNDGNDGCIETMAEVFRNTVRIGGM